MELRHLRHFVAVAEERHFGRAAARLGIEQSPLSRSIRQLEGQLETALLERGSRASQLTQAGNALLPEARAILGQVARLKSLCVGSQASNRLRLRLGVCDAVATIRLSICLSVLRERHPDLAVEVLPLGPTEAINAVESGVVDVSLALDPVASTGVTRVHCWTERFVVAVTSEWTFSPRAHIPVADILAVDEILVAEAWAPAAERWLHELAIGTTGGIPPVRRLSSCLGLFTSIGMNFGIGLVPSGLEDRLDWAAVSTRAVEGRNPRLPVVLLYSENNQHPGIAALRSVVGTRPWRGSTMASLAAPAGIPDHSP
jgi:DNA-binding transcriptional LysR family regulator